MKKVTVIGSGSWGTALAVMLAKNDHEIMIWSRRQDAVDELINDRKNERYLPGIVIPENIKATTDRESAVEGAGELSKEAPYEIIVNNEFAKKAIQ